MIATIYRCYVLRNGKAGLAIRCEMLYSRTIDEGLEY